MLSPLEVRLVIPSGRSEEQTCQLLAGVVGAHEGLTDQEGVDTACTHPADVLGRQDPTFGHQ
jgi:hypothetical protein